jgi:CBS-domain-containing membrane protein
VIRAIENASGDTIVLDCASTNLVTVRADDTLHEAIRKLLVHEIGRLPVVANDDPSRLVGYLGRGAILSARWKGIQEEFTEPPSWPRSSKSGAPPPSESSAAQNRS